MVDFVETVDAPDGTGTPYELQIGQTAIGTLLEDLSGTLYGDHDWFSVNLEAGTTYTFAMVGTGTNGVKASHLELHELERRFIDCDRRRRRRRSVKRERAPHLYG